MKLRKLLIVSHTPHYLRDGAVVGWGATVREIASTEGLRFVQRRNHGLILPGMGSLPNRWLLDFDRFVLGSSTLSRLAPSSVLLFEK